MMAKSDIRRVQEWMGHADVQTTMRYPHYAPREEDARLVAEAFEVALRACVFTPSAVPDSIDNRIDRRAGGSTLK